MINEAIEVINFIRKRPMLFLAAIISISCLLAYYSFFATAVFAAVVIVLLFIFNYNKRNGVLIFCGLWLLASVLSAVHNVSELERVSTFDGMTVSGEFIVIGKTENNGKSYACEVEVLNSRLLRKGDKLLAVYDGPVIPLGQSFRASTRVEKFDEGVVAKSFYAENIYMRAELSHIVLTNNNDFVLSGMNGIRGYIKDEIFKYYEKDEAATVLALLTGNRSYLSDEFYSNLKGAGVAHVMVVSGMHLSIIVMFLLKIINKLLYNRFLKGTIIFMTVLAMAAVCGFTMSILRAGITYVLFAIALFVNRQPSGDNCLGTAVAVILIINPFAIFSVAFLLSVFSTFGILCIALPTVEFLEKEKLVTSKWLLTPISAIFITLSALLTTLPISILTFGYVSNMSIMTNLLISFATTVVICLCIVGFVLFPLKGIIFYLGGWVVKYINWVINFFGGADFATTDLPPWAAIIATILIIIVLFVMIACGNQNFVLRLKGISNKKIKEGGGRLKWRSFSKKD